MMPVLVYLYDMKLRPAQIEILKYESGKLAVSAVPGSGKTFSLSLLAAQILSKGLIAGDRGQSVLVVTYLNASVERFRASIRRQLASLDLPNIGFEVRTLHSLGFEIVQMAESGFAIGGSSMSVLDMSQINRLLAESTALAIHQHPKLWNSFIGGDQPRSSAKWRTTLEDIAGPFIKNAKNHCIDAEEIIAQLDLQGHISESHLLLRLLAEIYVRYQRALKRNGAYDFDDLIWRAVALVNDRSDLRSLLADRWPYVLEDEAQDSIPLQEELLNEITSINQNWVRVGDPNQAITSSFTSAHPIYFTNFLKRSDVTSVNLTTAGRSAIKIIDTANYLIDWTCSEHPLRQVREQAFRQQRIRPTSEGDDQPNPMDGEAKIEIKVFVDRDDNEIPQVALKAHRYSQNNPEHSIAILVPTNEFGRRLAVCLEELDAVYVDRLSQSGRSLTAIRAISSILSLLSDPLGARNFAAAYETFLDFGPELTLDSSVDLKHVNALIKSIVKPEEFLFPLNMDIRNSLPRDVANDVEIEILGEFSSFLHQFYLLQPLPNDDLILAISERLFHNSGEPSIVRRDINVAVASQLAVMVRSWEDQYPEWRLPEIVDQMRELSLGRFRLYGLATGAAGYEPAAGSITLTTQHSAKGMEWDAVFITGLDSFWLPSSLDDRFLGLLPEFLGDPKAESQALLKVLMDGKKERVMPIDATDSAHIEIICERLRLLYVGITRARLYLHMSRSRQITRYNRVEYTNPSRALEAVYNHLDR